MAGRSRPGQPGLREEPAEAAGHLEEVEQLAVLVNEDPRAWLAGGRQRVDFERSLPLLERLREPRR
jgi:hypothetical protein